MPRHLGYAERRTLATVDDYLTPVDARFADPERDIHDALLDCAILHQEMLATLAQRDAAKRRWAALQRSRRGG